MDKTEAAREVLAREAGRPLAEFSLAEWVGAQTAIDAMLAFASPPSPSEGENVREACAKIASGSWDQLKPFVHAGAIAWCGDKERETDGDDVRYFEANWFMPGLLKYVIAAAIRAMPIATAPQVQAEGAIPEGMVPWHGGDSAPDDWDGSEVLLGDRSMGDGNVWDHHESRKPLHIIAYRSKEQKTAARCGYGHLKFFAGCDECAYTKFPNDPPPSPTLDQEQIGVGFVPAGMVRWRSDVNEPPVDWDGGPVLFRDGWVARPGSASVWDTDGDDWDIIAYTPDKAPVVADAGEEREKLREALEPFASACESLDDDHRDLSPIWESGAAMSITAGDLRRARDALNIHAMQGGPA